MTKKISRLVALLLVLALVAAACSADDESSSTTGTDDGGTETTSPDTTQPSDGSSDTTEPSDNSEVRRGGTLTVAHFVDPRTLDPFQDGGFEANFMGINIRDGLTQINENRELEGSLATEWEQPDALTYIFTIREGVKFHDGSDFDVEDVKYTFDTLLDPEIAAYAGNYTPLIESTEILDDGRFQVNLKVPWPFFLWEMAVNSTTRIVPKDYHLPENHLGDNTVIGTGPYMVKEWTRGGELVLERFPDYWNPDEAFVDEIVFKVVPDEQTQLIQLQAGQVDVVLAVPPSAAAALEADPAITVNSGQSGKSQELLLNTLVPPFDNLNIRKAVLMAVDRQEVIDLGAFGFGDVPTDLFPEYLEEFNPDNSWDVFDPEAAVALLQDEGFSEGNPLQFELRTINTNFFIDQAAVLKNQFESLGGGGLIEVEVTPMEKSAFLAPLFRQEDPTQWQAALEMYSFSTDPQSFYWEQFAKDSFINSVNVNLDGGVQVPELEEVVNAALAAESIDEAKEFYSRELELIMENALQLRVAYFDNIQAIGPDVRNFKSLSSFEYPLRLVWLDR